MNELKRQGGLYKAGWGCQFPLYALKEGLLRPYSNLSPPTPPPLHLKQHACQPEGSKAPLGFASRIFLFKTSSVLSWAACCSVPLALQEYGAWATSIILQSKEGLVIAPGR